MERTDPIVQPLYDEAVKRYLAITGKALDDPSFTRLSSIEDVIDSLDGGSEQFEAFRERRGKLYHRLANAMRPVEHLGTSLSGAAATAWPPCALVFGAVKLLIDAAKGVSNTYDAICSLFEELKVRSSSSTWFLATAK
jgi:hypothetical protein